MKLTVLVDNISNNRLKSEWGLSIYVEYEGKKVLVDFGASDIFIENAENLGINLKDIDISILSHAHYDHGNGIGAFLEYNKKAKLYISETVCENCYSIQDDGLIYEGLPKGTLEKYNDKIVRCKGLTEISSGIYTLFHTTKDTEKIGEFEGMLLKTGDKFITDNLLHEHTIIFRTEKGLVIVSPCSHIGADNIINEVKNAFKDEKIYAIIGGFHLYNKTEEYTKEFSKRLKETGIKRVITGHCTRDRYSILNNEIGDILERLETGLIIEI